MAVLAQTGEAIIQPLTYMTLAGLPAFNSNGDTVIEPLLLMSLSALPAISTSGFDFIQSNLFIPLLAFITPYGTGAYEITGVVQNSSSAPLSRTVIAVSRSDNIPLDVTLSDPVTGAFTLRVPLLSCYVVCLPNIGDGANAEIYDRVTPVLP
jgi:hypothetical protein